MTELPRYPNASSPPQAGYAPPRPPQLSPTPHHEDGSPPGPDHQEKSRKVEPSPKSSHGWLYGLAGFVLGAVFWHAVGFWAFVSEAVFSGPREQIARPAQSPTYTGSITTGSIRSTAVPSNAGFASSPFSPARPTPAPAQTPNGKQAGALNSSQALEPVLPTGTLNCADLALDRQTGTTWSGACDPLVATKDGAGSDNTQRSDQLPIASNIPTAAGWSAAVETSSNR
ncbi:MAG: hypothetical protein AAFV69_03405 [Pseudomonadota bacterium]